MSDQGRDGAGVSQIRKNARRPRELRTDKMMKALPSITPGNETGLHGGSQNCLLSSRDTEAIVRERCYVKKRKRIRRRFN